MTIYLDHAATTPLRPEVREAMLPFLDEAFGNPSSIHQYGRRTRAAIDQAREQMAHALHTKPSQITFTSGGTEADNLAVVGVALHQREQGKQHIITSQIEHHAVLDACKYLERIGFAVTYLPVDQTGKIEMTTLQEAFRPDTALVSIMYGNNEVGTLQPIREIGELCRERGVLFHTDAVQALGIEEINVSQLPIDLLTLSAHKINGPKGVGALYSAKHVPFVSRAFGGFQERRHRPGTENVLGIVGLGKAIELATAERVVHRDEMLHLRNLLLQALANEQVPFTLNGDVESSLPHICNLSLLGLDTETWLMNLDMEGIACASGSACTAGSLEISHVLIAMHLGEARIHSAIRFSLGRGNTEADMLQVAQTIAKIRQRTKR